MLNWKRKKSSELISAPEWLIVGLGNPGPEYRWTRHNVGFDLIDLLAQNQKIAVSKGKHRSLYGIGTVADVRVGLVKPMTYMNESGQAVGRWVKELGLPLNRVLVISDDIHLDVGVLRLREKGSAGGHNGLKSIEASLGSNEYLRLRIGVGKPVGNQVDYVLGRLNKQEAEVMETALSTGVEVIKVLILGGVAAAQAVAAQKNS